MGLWRSGYIGYKLDFDGSKKLLKTTVEKHGRNTLGKGAKMTGETGVQNRMDIKLKVHSRARRIGP
jgi:hypothetical protein